MRGVERVREIRTRLSDFRKTKPMGGNLWSDKRGSMQTFAALLMLTALSTSACGRDSWEGFVYPDRENLRQARFLGAFDALEACRDAALAELDKLRARDRGDYECGLNCRVDPRTSVRVCKETVR